MQLNHQVPDVFVPWKTVLAALGCGLCLTACNRQTQAPPPPAPEVATITVARQSVLLTTELPGRTSPFRIAEIRPQVNGLIQKRLFTEGADVKEGQDLYQIDPAPFQAALDNAQAALGRAEANLPAIQVKVNRYKDALADKAVSQQDYDDASAALKQAQADILYYKAMVETARINLGYTRVVSPISGRIGKSTVTDGAIVTAYQPVPLATIQQLDPIYVDVPQSTTALLALERRLKEERINHDGTIRTRCKLILEDGTAYPLEGTLAVPRCLSGSDDRLRDSAGRLSQSEWRSSARHVRPGSGQRRRQRPGHSDPAASGRAQSEGGSGGVDRGRGWQGRTTDAQP